MKASYSRKGSMHTHRRFLSQGSYDVTMVNAGSEMAKEAPVVVLDFMLDRSRQRGVKMLTDTRIMK